MNRKEVIVALGALMVFSSQLWAQQLNPFTAVLTESLSRPKVKEGRKRINIKSSIPRASQPKNRNIPVTEIKRRQRKVTRPELAKSEIASNEPNLANHSEVAKQQPTTHMQPEVVKTDGMAAGEQVTDDLRRTIGVHYQILTEDAQGNLRVDDPNRVYRSGEAFRIKVRTNVNAFLYLINEEAGTGTRRLLMPNYKYQRQSARVQPFEEVIIPSLDQPAFEFDNNPGEECLIVIASRDEIPSLQIERVGDGAVGHNLVPADINEALASPDGAAARDFVWVKEEKATAGKTAGVYVVNTSHQDNEEIVYIIRLKHRN